MRRLRACVRDCFLAGLIALGSTAACSEPLWLVVHKDVLLGNMTREQVADLYLGRLKADRLTPLDRSEEELRAAFYQRLNGQSLSGIRAYWAKRVFTGRGRPPETVAEEDVKRVLGRSNLVITYVYASQKPADSKVVLVLDEEKAR